MATTPRHARTSSPRPRQAARPAKNAEPTVSTSLRRAARAAYTRTGTSIPFERRPPARQAYWTWAARRALEAALDPDELADVITAHSRYEYDHRVGLYRCVCGGYLTSGWPDHITAAIRAHVLGPEPQTGPPGTGEVQATTRGGAPDRDRRRARLPHPGGHRWPA
ncbi:MULTISPECIES: hypothetical protein [Promicromonospora]|uniref:Transcription factor WhiB n=2 Tax=Promicromonospora TaxID=43676 RepID=A0ABP8YCK4_9MICO|nr:hypothetical protein [Promicromonospora umidemergens]